MEEQHKNEITKETEQLNPALTPQSGNLMPAALQQRIERLYADEKLDLLFMQKAAIMAKSRILPPMFQGDEYACYSLQRIAFQWQTDPTLLAPGLYKATPQAPLSLDGKTVKSVIDRFAPIKDHFIKDEYFGDWDKILGKFEVKQSKKQDEYGNYKTYKVPAWKPEDEQGLGIRLTATLNNGHTVTYELKLTQCLTRNSTLWAEDPQLQIYYRAIARFSRKYFPYILNGMYIAEEFMDNPDGVVIDITEQAETVQSEEAKTEKKASKASKLKDKFNVGSNDDLLAAAEQDKKTVSERICEAIAAVNAPISLDEVKLYMSSRGILDNYDVDDLEKYPENWRNRMTGDLTNLINQAAEWVLSR